MSEAEIAVENAFRFESKKDSLRQTQDGLWKVTFTVQASDMPQGLLMAAMGTRFMLAACEIGDDETPVQQPDEAKATPGEQVTDDPGEPAESEEQSDAAIAALRADQDKPDPYHYQRQAGNPGDKYLRTGLNDGPPLPGHKDNSHHYQRQAGIRCNEANFYRFLWSEYDLNASPDYENTDASILAAEAVRLICRVNSRKEFDTDPEAAKRWRGLLASYDLWKRGE